MNLQIAPLKSLFHKQSVNTYVPLIDTKYGNRTVFTLRINAHISHILICDEHIYVTHPQRTILKRPFRSFPNKPLDIRHRLCISNKKYRQFPGTHRVESWTLINLSQDDESWCWIMIMDSISSWVRTNEGSRFAYPDGHLGMPYTPPPEMHKWYRRS